ncbi:MAG: CARDB domain-containing protein [bacterium]
MDKNISALVVFLVMFFCVNNVSGETFEQPYYSDGADHSTSCYINGAGTHSFMVIGVPFGSYNYVAYKNTGAGYVQFWESSTAIGMDPTATTSVSPGNIIKLTIWDGSWNVKSVYYWYIYAAALPDLVVTSVWTEPAVPVSGESYVIKATVKNQGIGTWILTTSQCRFYLNSSLVSSVGHGNLVPGDSITLSSGTLTASAADTYVIRAVADATEQVGESNESNNERSSSFAVQQCPALWLSTNTLTFGYTTNSQSLTIRNSGAGSLTFTNTTDKSWLYVNPSEGVSTGETVTATVFVDCSAMLIGTTSGVVTVVSQTGSSNVLVTVTISDSDGDQTPDGWEVDNFGSVANCNPHLDWDGDGVKNRDEWISGTNPKNSESHFRVGSIAWAGNNGLIRVEWPTLPGRLYDIYWAQHLNDTFLPLGSNLPYTQNFYLDSASVPSGFYKVTVRLATP